MVRKYTTGTRKAWKLVRKRPDGCRSRCYWGKTGGKRDIPFRITLSDTENTSQK